MLTLHEKSLLDEIVEWNDAEEAVRYLIESFAGKGYSNALHILGLIQDVGQVVVKKATERENDFHQAAWWLIAQREMKPDSSGILFSTMLPVCKAMFPNGNADRCSEVQKRYFQKFVDMLRDKKQFSWDRDKTWADTNGYTEYIRNVERQLRGEK